MRVIYIAGPYRADSEWAVRNNVMKADEAAQSIWLAGGVALCPHKNTQSFGGLVDDKVFIDGDIELLRRCDAVYAISGWEGSAGARGEVEFAKASGIPVFYQGVYNYKLLDFFAEE